MSKISDISKRCKICYLKNIRHESVYGCAACQVNLCKQPSCFWEFHGLSPLNKGSTKVGFLKDIISGAIEVQEVQHVDGSMAPVEDMDFSDDEGLEDLDDIDEESDIKEEERSPESHLPSTTHGHAHAHAHAQSAAGLSSSKDRDDVLTARQLRIALFALCDGLRQASRVFSADMQLIQSWLKEARKRLKQSEQEQEDHAEGRNRMVAWVLSMREQQLPITESSLFHKASTLKKKGSFSDSFRISYDWAVSFMLQHQLGVRSIGREASLARSLPLSLEAKIKSFREFTQKVIQVNKLSESTVAAMDELCLFVDLRLVQDKSRCSEALELAGSLPLVTVYLSVLSEGVLLPSLVVANRQLAEKTLPEFVLLEAGTDSLTVEEALGLWTNKVWLQRVSSPTQPSKSVLVLDRHREHLGDTFLTSISGSGTLPAMIPGGCSFRLQPLEICLKPVLQRFLLSRWTKFTAGNPKELEETSPLRLQANVAQLLVDWIVEALTHMNKLSELWKKSFHLTELLPKQEEEEEVEKIQSDLVKTLTEILLGPEALEEDSLELLDDDDDTLEEEEQGGGEDRQEDKDVEEGKGGSKHRGEGGKETKEDKEVEEEGKETKEGGRLQDADEEGQETIKGREDRKVTDNRLEDTKKIEEDERETGEDRSKEIKKPMEDSKEGGKETEQGSKEEAKETGEDNEEEGEETGDSKEEIKKLEEDSEEEGKETEEDRKEVSKERRETRIVIGEEVGDEWKITVKSRTEGVEDDS